MGTKFRVLESDVRVLFGFGNVEGRGGKEEVIYLLVLTRE